MPRVYNGDRPFDPTVTLAESLGAGDEIKLQIDPDPDALGTSDAPQFGFGREQGLGGSDALEIGTMQIAITDGLGGSEALTCYIEEYAQHQDETAAATDADRWGDASINATDGGATINPTSITIPFDANPITNTIDIYACIKSYRDPTTNLYGRDGTNQLELSIAVYRALGSLITSVPITVRLKAISDPAPMNTSLPFLESTATFDAMDAAGYLTGATVVTFNRTLAITDTSGNTYTREVFALTTGQANTILLHNGWILITVTTATATARGHVKTRHQAAAADRPVFKLTAGRSTEVP